MKRYLATLTAALLGAHIVAGIPAAHAATTVPATVQVKDPVDDANGLNDQDNAYGTPAQGQGDHTTPKDAGSATDFMDIWYTNDADTVSLHIHTQAPPSNLAEDVYFRVASNPGKGDKGSDDTRGCIYWTAFFNGTAGAYTDPDAAAVQDKCNVGDAIAATVTVEALDDGTGVITLTAPRSYSPLFADGSTLTKTYGVSRVLVVGPVPQEGIVTAGTSDTTQRGTDYAIAASGVPQPGPSTTPPVKKHKKVKKGKKPPAPAGCPAYQPGDLGKDAKTTVVTDAATKDAPVSVQLTMDPGAGTGTGTPADAATLAAESQLVQNVQVDSSKPTTGLYVRAEFDTHSDDDLYLYNPDGSEAAHAAGFNIAPETLPVAPFGQPLDGTGSGGHSESGAEQIDGIATADCQGYTAQLNGATTAGGTITFKFWLGEATYDPSSASAGAAMPI